IRRESFRELLSDVHELPETQRTALLLREMDALSYEQIAQAMETTVPSVKSLLVRARISLAEAAEARKLSCAEVRFELGEVAEGLVKLSAPARRHVRGCERCRSFKRQLKANNHALAAVLPVGPLLILKKLLLAKLGSAGSAHVAGGAGAGATVGAAAAGGAGATGGIFTVGAGALATKAVAGLAAAAIVGAGVAADQSTHHRRHHAAASAATAPVVREPQIVAERTQPVSSLAYRSHSARAAGLARHAPPVVGAATLAVPAKVAPTTPVAAVTDPAKPATPEPQITQVTTETTQLPSAATADGQPAVATAPASVPPAGETPATPAAAPTPTTTTVTTTPVTPAPAGPGEGPTGGAAGSGTTTPPVTGAPVEVAPAPSAPKVQPGPEQEATGSTSSPAPLRRARTLARGWGAKR
ncbi:MAG: hypothetical protein QOF54_426, partial [Solirubrobacteraceae bacterium]|nr:hypothetical protein [Solirubrobacteraceae bacterium]